MEILHLTLHRMWFLQILDGIKTEEYRENKPYWQIRLRNKTYTHVKFVNGYGKDKPWMFVVCKGITEDPDHLGAITGTGGCKEVYETMREKEFKCLTSTL